MKVKFYNDMFKKQDNYFLGFSLFKPTKIGYTKFPLEIRFFYIFGCCGIVFGKKKEEQ